MDKVDLVHGTDDEVDLLHGLGDDVGLVVGTDDEVDLAIGSDDKGYVVRLSSGPWTRSTSPSGPTTMMSLSKAKRSTIIGAYENDEVDLAIGFADEVNLVVGFHDEVNLVLIVWAQRVYIFSIFGYFSSNFFSCDLL